MTALDVPFFREVGVFWAPISWSAFFSVVFLVDGLVWGELAFACILSVAGEHAGEEMTYSKKQSQKGVMDGTTPALL